MTHIYGIDSEGLEYVSRASRIASDVAAPASDEVDAQGRFPSETIDALREAGLLGIHLPREVGGLGQGPSVFAGVVEEIARACGSSAMVYVMHVAATQSHCGFDDGWQQGRITESDCGRRAHVHAGMVRTRISVTFLGAGFEAVGKQQRVRHVRNEILDHLGRLRRLIRI